jgi:hypothetical protein
MMMSKTPKPKSLAQISSELRAESLSSPFNDEIVSEAMLNRKLSSLSQSPVSSSRKKKRGSINSPLKIHSNGGLMNYEGLPNRFPSEAIEEDDWDWEAHSTGGSKRGSFGNGTGGWMIGSFGNMGMGNGDEGTDSSAEEEEEVVFGGGGGSIAGEELVGDMDEIFSVNGGNDVEKGRSGSGSGMSVAEDTATSKSNSNLNLTSTGGVNVEDSFTGFRDSRSRKRKFTDSLSISLESNPSPFKRRAVSPAASVASSSMGSPNLAGYGPSRLSTPPLLPIQGNGSVPPLNMNIAPLGVPSPGGNHNHVSSTYFGSRGSSPVPSLNSGRSQLAASGPGYISGALGMMWVKGEREKLEDEKEKEKTEDGVGKMRLG